MNRSVVISAIASLAVTLSACGGGGQTGNVGASTAAVQHAAQGSAVLLIPARTASASARTPAYVSPSASSVAIAVNGATPATADISTTSTLCTTTSAGRSCTVPFVAPNGSDTIVFTLYDAANGTGNVLGVGSTVATVTGGQPFAVTVSVGGTVAKLVLTAPAKPLAVGTPSTVAIAVNAQDSGGNTIVGTTPFAAPITLTDSDTSGSTSLSATSVAAPGATVTLAYNGGAVTGGQVTISATGPNLNTSAVTPAVVAISSGSCAPLTTTNHLYVANDGGGNILQFAPPYSATGTSLNSIGNPVAIAVDHLGNVFAAAYGSGGGTSNAGSIQEFSPPYTNPPAATIGSGVIAGPRGIAIDGNNDLFITDAGNNRILEFAPPYTAAPTVLETNVSASYGIALSPNCDLFVTSGPEIIEYAPPYTNGAATTIMTGIRSRLSLASITTGNASPISLAFDPAGDLFVGDNVASAVYVYDPPYTSGPAQTIALPSQAGPLGLALDANLNLFVNEYSISAIAEYAPPYTAAPVTTITSNQGLSLPAGVAFGP